MPCLGTCAVVCTLSGYAVMMCTPVSFAASTFWECAGCRCLLWFKKHSWGTGSWHIAASVSAFFWDWQHSNSWHVCTLALLQRFPSDPEAPWLQLWCMLRKLTAVNGREVIFRFLGMFVILGWHYGMSGTEQNSHVALGWCGALSLTVCARVLGFDLSHVSVGMDCTGLHRLASCDWY
jgi:hypothetical protein